MTSLTPADQGQAPLHPSPSGEGLVAVVAPILRGTCVEGSVG